MNSAAVPDQPVRTKSPRHSGEHPALSQHRAQIDSRLTARQAEVLELASLGLTASRIAERLGLSHNTVKVHLRLAYRRLEVHSRVGALNRLHLGNCPHCGGDLSSVMGAAGFRPE